MADSEVRYGIEDLAALGGVSRRTVRYYVQEGLIPPPFGLGRGNHYGPAHLERLQHVKSMQEAGRTLDDIRRELDRGTRPSREVADRVAPSAPGRPGPVAGSRSVWQRLVVAQGVELHVETSVFLPSPGALRELADWCQRHLGVAAARPGHEEQD